MCIYGYLICYNSVESKMFHVKNSAKLNNKLIKNMFRKSNQQQEKRKKQKKKEKRFVGHRGIVLLVLMCDLRLIFSTLFAWFHCALSDFCRKRLLSSFLSFPLSLSRFSFALSSTHFSCESLSSNVVISCQCSPGFIWRSHRISEAGSKPASTLCLSE